MKKTKAAKKCKHVWSPWLLSMNGYMDVVDMRVCGKCHEMQERTPQKAKK